MNYEKFNDQISNLANWCNKKVSNAQLDFYWNEVKNIPDDPFEEIIKSIIRSTAPGRLLPSPNDILKQWSQWLAVHPQHKAQEHPVTWCDECAGEGCFLVWYLPKEAELKNYLLNGKQFENYYHKYLPCSMCQNWKRVFPTRGELRPRVFYTKDRILQTGWLLEDPYDTQEHKQKIAESLEV